MKKAFIDGASVIIGIVVGIVSTGYALLEPVVDETNSWNPIEWAQYGLDKRAERLQCLDDLNVTKRKLEECEQQTKPFSVMNSIYYNHKGDFMCLPGESPESCGTRRVQ